MVFLVSSKIWRVFECLKYLTFLSVILGVELVGIFWSKYLRINKSLAYMENRQGRSPCSIFGQNTSTFHSQKHTQKWQISDPSNTPLLGTQNTLKTPWNHNRFTLKKGPKKHPEIRHFWGPKSGHLSDEKSTTLGQKWSTENPVSTWAARPKECRSWIGQPRGGKRGCSIGCLRKKYEKNM